MRKCYTCTCGGQIWSIYENAIKCQGCGAEYTLEATYNLPSIEVFNDARDAQRAAEEDPA